MTSHHLLYYWSLVFVLAKLSSSQIDADTVNMTCNVQIYWLWKSRHRQTFWRWWQWRRMLFLKLLNPFLCSQFHCLFTSLSWAHLRVWNLYTLINLAYCWIYCKLKLHSSPNTISFTVEIIWNYFLTLLICL